jgi:integrase
VRKRSDNVKAMKGGIRRPRTDGQSYSFVLDVGLQDAQRCDACGRRGRFWVGAKLLQACPVCGGEVHATRERRVIEKSGFASFKDAELARAEELVKRGRGGYIIPARITTAAWLRQWLAGLNREGARSLKPLTVESYGRHVAQHLIGPRQQPFPIGMIELAKLTPEAIESHYAKLARPYPAEDKKGKLITRPGLSLNSRRRVHACLHRSLNEAVRRRLITRNPAWRITPFAQDGEEENQPALHCWTPEELQTFLESVADDRLYAMWFLFAHYGMRRGEVLALRWKDVDLEHGRLTVRRNRVPLEGGKVVEGTTKTKRIRELPLGESALKVLRDHRSAQRGGQVVDLARTKAEAEAYLFTDKTGEPLNPNSVTWRFRAAVSKAGVPRIRLHDVRHTCGTSMLQKGVNPTVVAKILGHSNTTTTLNVYSHALNDAVVDAVDVMATIIEKGSF